MSLIEPCLTLIAELAKTNPLVFQMSPAVNRRSCSFANCGSAALRLTSWTQWLTSRERRSSARLSTSWWNTSPAAAVCSLNLFIRRLSKWYVLFAFLVLSEQSLLHENVMISFRSGSACSHSYIV